MNTTGKSNCLLLMHMSGGNAFEYFPGERCRVHHCPQAPVQDAQAAPVQPNVPEVWSTVCDFAKVKIVAVHLFEWTWADVAHECESHLGPAGYNAVQVAPPQESILGDSWFIHYQPVSYKLETRQGSEIEFADMVKRCHQSGVNVIVDAVINHMATTFLANTATYRNTSDALRAKGLKPLECGPEGAQLCEGWAGTIYKDREYSNNDPSLDAFSAKRNHFHTYPWSVKENCAWNFQDNKEGYFCDMEALPDLNTENLEVQYMQRAFMIKLFSMGVTMLRVDAARSVWPEDTAKILSVAPWDFVFQEWLADFKDTPVALNKSHLTDLKYGHHVGNAVYDQCMAWHCFSYERSGGNTSWCKSNPVVDGTLVSYFGSDSPCGSCHCCQLKMKRPPGNIHNSKGECSDDWKGYEYDFSAGENEAWCRTGPKIYSGLIQLRFFEKDSPCHPFSCCKKVGGWLDNTAGFSKLLELGTPEHYHTYAPEDRSLVFLSNHDDQRWGVWGGLAGGEIWPWYDEKPVFKAGALFHVIQLFTLAWPYGDAMRLMSSYSFTNLPPHNKFQGPPGVRLDSLRDPVLPVFANGNSGSGVSSAPLRCKTTPAETPRSDAWEEDEEHPWVCEHRWEGVAPFVRLRWLLDGEPVNKTWKDDDHGHIAFTRGKQAFFAFTRGKNMVTQSGSLQSFNLTGLETGLPMGRYCNLAQISAPLGTPVLWEPSTCPGEAVELGQNGTIISSTLLPAGKGFGIHTGYRFGSR